MHDFERLGAFFLGSRFDPASRTTTGEPLLYDARDLTTHAACIGMTGSGKTGLAVALLEEALLDGIPCLVIDPKGDLGNLLLTFPDLAPADFAPWVDPEEARRLGISAADLAARQASLWRDGLAASGQDGDRIRRLRAAADVALYTPGSRNGRPVAAIRSFAAPAPAIVADADALNDRIVATTTSLLTLLGIDADPLRSREHILVARILEDAWRAGRDLDTTALVRAIQDPAVTRIGAFDLETFFPARDRFALALQLNNLLASPAMQAWLDGDPLDIAAFLHAPDGRPRASIFSIAHLADAERMFFVTLLLTEVLAWMRAQPGSSSLRAILYMDEVFGFFPPVANPPSKPPLLTLLKQARAFGLGVVLATQNPVDLDYRGLANIGTWFLGRLQTEQDRNRVLDGLQSANSPVDRATLERLLASLGKRVFLMNNVHDDAPELFQTRWTMSFLRGPLSRDEIARLARPSAVDAPAATPPVLAVPAAPAAGTQTGDRPAVPPDIGERFLAAPTPAATAAAPVYVPAILGSAAVDFRSATAGVDTRRTVTLLARLGDGPEPLSWETAEALAAAAFAEGPRPGARFAPLPAAALVARNYPAWSRRFASHLRAAERIEILRHRATGLLSSPEESPRDFRVRVLERLRQERDDAVERLRQRWAPKLAALQERIRVAEQRVEREREDVQHQGMQTAIAVGASLLGALFGRRAVSAATVGRATSAARAAGRVLRERGDAERAAESVQQLQERLAELERAFTAEAQALAVLPAAGELELETVVVRPARGGVEVQRVELVWVPLAAAES